MKDTELLTALRDVKSRTHLGIGCYVENTPTRRYMLDHELIVRKTPRATRAQYVLTEKGEKIMNACEGAAR